MREAGTERGVKMGRVICKAKELGPVSRCGFLSIEWYKDGEPQYYCGGMLDVRTDMPLDMCLECENYADRAADDHEAWMERKNVAGNRRRCKVSKKVVLVMDMPERCFGCMFSRFTGRGHRRDREMQCVAWQETTGNADNFWIRGKEKHRMCPLWEMPERMKPWGEGVYEQGWNACIDAVMGGEKEC